MSDFATMNLAELNAWYCDHVGYSPLEDAPGEWTEETLREACRSYGKECWRHDA